ncbi:MAG: thiamine pyrophosphate-dependent enzyme [Thermomicrobiales bacterium]
MVKISASAIQPRQPGHWMDPGPLGTLGVGTPFAIAAKVAKPELIRFNLPVVGVVGNNAAWNQIRYGQIDKYGEERDAIANEPLATRYDRIVEAMGGYGEHVTGPGDIRPALERARESGKPALVNETIDPNVYSSGTRNQTMYR